jgi:hypothetical protein
MHAKSLLRIFAQILKRQRAEAMAAFLRIVGIPDKLVVLITHHGKVQR